MTAAGMLTAAVAAAVMAVIVVMVMITGSGTSSNQLSLKQGIHCRSSIPLDAGIELNSRLRQGLLGAKADAAAD